MNSFKRNIYKTGENKSCNLSNLIVTTVDPTNAEGSNGSATISFSGGQENLTYKLNGGVSVPIVSSPFTISNLQGNTSYTIIISDSISDNCTLTKTFNLGETSFVFEADYIMVTYQFLDGRDLDTRTRIVSPDVGQNAQNTYLGWSVRAIHPSTGTVPPYLYWGSDNTGTGYESVLLNVKQFLIQNPNSTSITMDMRGFWYGTQGFQNVSISATLWKGGTPARNGYIWENPTALSSFQINSTGKPITLVTKSGLSSGERIATFKYNLITNEGLLDNNDQITPSV